MISLPLPSGGYIKNIIHISDIHIRLGDRISSRYDEYNSVFENLYENIKNKCTNYTIIIITGDIFHNKNRIDNYGILLFNKLLGLLSQLSPVYIIQGNHDYQQHLSKNEPDILEASLEYIIKYNKNTYNNIFYLKETGHYVANNVGFGLVSIKDALKEGDTYGKTEELPLFPKIKIFPSTVNTYIALFHGQVIKTSIDNYKNIKSGYPLEWFNEYDFVMLGDIHLQQINDATIIINKEDKDDIKYSYEKNKTWAYSGSLIQQNYGETLYNHGYLEWDLENKLVKPHHIYNPYGYIKIQTLLELECLLINKNCPEFLYIRNNYSLEKDDIEKLLLKYNKKSSINFNHELITNNKNNKIKLETNNSINSTNSINSLIEYISSNITLDIDNYKNEWKEWINNPKKLLIENNIESLKDIIDTRNKQLIKYIDIYEHNIDIHNILHKTLTIDNIKWGWLLCFKDNNWFNFNTIDNNIAIINSPNGFGKSSFLEIVCLSLFGESIPSRYSRDYSSSIICQKIPNNEKAYTKIKIKINDKYYEIHRKFDYKFKDVNKIDNFYNELFYYDDDNIIKSLHKGKTSIQEWISKNIGTINTFLLSTMITQNTDNDFFGMKNTEQNNIIENSLNLESINNLSNIFKEIIKSYKFIKTNASSINNHIINKIDDSISLEFLEQNENELNIQNKEKETLINVINDLSNKITYNINDEDINKSINDIDNIIKDYSNKIKVSTNNKTIEKLYEEKGYIYSLITNHQLEAENIDDINIIKEEDHYNNILKEYQEHLNNKPKYTLNDLIELKETLNIINKKYVSFEKIKSLENKYYTTKPSIPLDKINSKLNDKNNKKLIENINNNDDYDIKILELKTEIDNFKKIIEDYNNINEEYIELLRNTIKKPHIDKEELESFIISYNKTLKNKNKLIEKISLNRNIINIKNNIDNYNIHINKYKDYHYNDDCWACKKQLWKKELDEIKIEKEKLEIEYNKYKVPKNINKILISDNEKLQYILDNELKYNNYLIYKKNWEDYDKWNIDILNIKERLDSININKKEELYDDLNKNYLLKELKEYLIVKENWEKYNKYLEIINILNKIPKDYNINNIDIDIEWFNILKNKEDKTNVCKDILNTLKSKKYLWIYNDILENINNYNYKSKLDYWKNIKIMKPILDEISLNKSNLDIIIKNINKLSQEYYKKKTIYENYINKKNELEVYIKFINNLDNKLKVLENILSKFANFRAWLYREKIIPKILHCTNSIISKISNRNLTLDANVNDDCIIQWYLNDGTNKPIIEKSSGFQKFIFGISIRIALSQLAGMKCNQLFIDEGFVACDAEHLTKVPDFLINLLEIYNSVVLVSHLDCIKEMNAIQINIKRKNDLSKIQFS